jgi:hypothetical protein
VKRSGQCLYELDWIWLSGETWLEVCLWRHNRYSNFEYRYIDLIVLNGLFMGLTGLFTGLTGLFTARNGLFMTRNEPFTGRNETFMTRIGLFTARNSAASPANQAVHGSKFSSQPLESNGWRGGWPYSQGPSLELSR